MLRCHAAAAVVQRVHVWLLPQPWPLPPPAHHRAPIASRAGELAFDASSPAVRAAVPEGLATLVDTPFAHPLLKLVLPQLEPLLFDSATRVRTAMADLLLSLRCGCQGWCPTARRGRKALLAPMQAPLSINKV